MPSNVMSWPFTVLVLGFRMIKLSLGNILKKDDEEYYRPILTLARHPMGIRSQPSNPRSGRLYRIWVVSWS